MEFKEKMTKIANMKLKTLKEEEITALIDDMLENAATADTELRYELIYPTLSKMITQGILSDKEFGRLLKTCMDDDHLFFKLGERADDSVFTRAFSSIVLVAIFDANAKKQILSVPELDGAFERVLQYIDKEMDTRGHVEGKGWAFAIAHAADMLQCLVQTPLITSEKFPDILAAVKTCLFKDGPYIDGEIDRLAAVAKLIMEKGFPSDILEAWMYSLMTSLADIQAAEGTSYRHYRVNTNVCNFLRSLYFAFKKEGERIKLRVTIFEIIKKF